MSRYTLADFEWRTVEPMLLHEPMGLAIGRALARLAQPCDLTAVTAA